MRQETDVFFANCQNYFMASLFLMSLFTTNHSLLGTWLPSLETDRGATNKAMLPVGYIYPGFEAQRRTLRKNSGHFFPKRLAVKENNQIPQNSESKYRSACHHTLSPGTNGSALRWMGLTTMSSRACWTCGSPWWSWRRSSERPEQVQLAGCLSADVGVRP